MQIKIRDFMGCETADISVGHIALLGGRNAQGKSSTCRAIAYALANNPVPAGLTKSTAGALLRSGAAKGSVEITTPEGKVGIAYPKAILSSEGTAPVSSVWAAGLRTIAELQDKERVETIRTLIGAEPTEADFVAACKDAGIDDKHVAPLWALIKKDGWSAAHTKGQDKGREIKSSWEYVTGEKYGEKKAENWIPRNFSAGIELSSKDSLDAIVTGAKADLECKIAQTAVDDDRLNTLKDKAEQIDALADKLAEAKGTEETTEEAYTKAAAALATMPRGVQRKPVECPHCAGAVFIDGQSIIKAEGLLSPEQITELADAHAKATESVAALKATAEAARRESAAAHAAHAEAVRAQAEVAALPPGGDVSQVEVDQAREAVRVAESDLKAWTQKTEADRLHKAVVANLEIVNLLSPEGVRRKVLLRALEAFNTELTEIADMCQWGAVTITPELEVEYKGRGYFFLSESEQFRARVTLQLALAEKEAAAAVVIDGADVLDTAGRVGLFNALRELGIPAVVGMTWLNKPEAMPDMGAAGIGQTYWVEGGKVVPVGAGAA